MCHPQAAANTPVIQIMHVSDLCYIPKCQHLHTPLDDMDLVINGRILTA
jgi:hypothetical protein